MLVKVIFLFLLVMLLIGMIGKLVFPGRPGGLARLRRAVTKAPTCPRCGRYMIGRTGCECGKS